MLGREAVIVEKRRSARAALLLLCAGAAFVLLLLCSQSSPLYPINTWVDANCLLTVGRVMKAGGVVYRDIYEQKGPLLYLIHALAACISDTSFAGVFVMEVVSLTAVLYMACRLGMRRRAMWAAFASAVLMGAAVLTGGAFMMGDSAEEFCLPFLMGALALAFSGYEEGGRPMEPKALFFCGLMAGAVALIKFTVLGLFVGLCAAEGVFALREGGLARALRSALVFLAGMLIPVAAACAYFAAHGALGDFYTAYVHNNIFLYQGGARTAADILREIYAFVRGNVLWVLLSAAGMIAMLADKKTRPALRFALITMALGAFAAVFLPGRAFAYYPLVLSAFGFATFCAAPGLADRLERRGAQLAACVCACALAAALAVCASPNRPLRGVKRDELPQARLAAQMEEGATLLQYSHLDDGLYLIADTLPQERFFCRLNVSYPLMRGEMDRYLIEALPDYVLVSWEELPARFDRYRLVASDAGYDDQNRINKMLYLYQRK